MSRQLHFDNEDQALLEIHRLRAGYSQQGNWSLPQMAWHLVIPLDKYLNVPADPNAPLTEKQQAMKAGFVDYICQNDKLPPHANTAPPDWTPPSTANESDIERLEAGLLKLKNYPHAKVEMGPIGVIDINECRRVHLVHIAHHLGFLTPHYGPRIGLSFANGAAAVADVNQLRRGYKQAGNWTLQQICWHLATILESAMRAPDGPVPPATPEQAAMLQQLLSTARVRAKIETPPQAVPPTSADASAIDRFIASFTKLDAYTGPWRPHRLFGPISPDDYRKLSLMHAAHHLAFLVPEAASR